MNGNLTRDKRRSIRFAPRENRSIAASTGAKQVCGTCGCGTSQSASVARYDSDGSCASWFDISCETQWRLRDCLKLTLCEFLACVADSYCASGSFEKPIEVDADGNPVFDPVTGQPVEKDLGDVLMECLCESACTVLHCVPDAICGPRQSECIPPPALECNFAVEEKD